jgi:Bacterial SH3 domain
MLSLARRALPVVPAVILGALLMACAGPDSEPSASAEEEASADDANLTEGQQLPAGAKVKVNVSKLNLREGPRASGTVVVRLSKGTIATVSEASGRNGWLHVTANNEEGWIAGKYADRVAAGPTDVPPASSSCEAGAQRTINVASAAALKSALQTASEGEAIVLKAGTYVGTFKLITPGVRLCGQAGAILDGGNVAAGYALQLEGANAAVVSGLTIRNAKKGLMIDQTSDAKLSKLVVEHVGEEAVHFRNDSKRNTLSDSVVRETGLTDARYGEGVYFGSDVGKWQNNEPDHSDGNVALRVTISNVAAECFDVKEGTRDGRIEACTCDGSNIRGENSADSGLDLKGNGYMVKGNTFTYGGGGVYENAIQIHERVSGWGEDNRIEGNTLRSDEDKGCGITVQNGRRGNVIACSNQVSGFQSLVSGTCE